MATSRPPLRMPLHTSDQAPKFNGKRLKEFLFDFEQLCDLAQLNDDEKKKWLVSYSRGITRKFIETLAEYRSGTYDSLKAKIQESFPSEEEEQQTTIEAFYEFVTVKRSIWNKSEFNAYYREFIVHSKTLMDRKILSEQDRNGAFWEGIGPRSVVNQLENYLLLKSLWTDRSAPPTMESVKTAAFECLKHDVYIRGSQVRRQKMKMAMEESSDKDDDADDNDREHAGGSDGHETPEQRYVPPSKKVVEDPMKTEIPKNAIQDLTERLERLAMTLDRKGRDQVVEEKNTTVRSTSMPRGMLNVPNRFGSERSVPVCWMCGKTNSHQVGHRNCPEAQELVSQGLLKLDATTGRLMTKEGNPLPRWIDDERIPIAQKVRDKELKGTTSNLELDRERIALAEHYQYAMDPDYELGILYETFPAESGIPERRSDRLNKKNPYHRDEKPKEVPVIRQETPTLKPPRQEVYVELPPVAKRHFGRDESKVPVVVPREKPNDEDTSMEDGEMKEQHKSVGKTPMNPKAPIEVKLDHRDPKAKKPTESSSKPGHEKIAHKPIVAERDREPVKKKVAFKDSQSKLPKVELKVGKDKKETRASPAFHISTELQESTELDDVYERVLNQEVKLTLRELLGSSFEMSRKFQQGTKSIRVPKSSSDLKTKHSQMAEVNMVLGTEGYESDEGAVAETSSARLAMISLEPDSESSDKELSEDDYYDSDDEIEIITDEIVYLYLNMAAETEMTDDEGFPDLYLRAEPATVEDWISDEEADTEEEAVRLHQLSRQAAFDEQHYRNDMSEEESDSEIDSLVPDDTTSESDTSLENGNIANQDRQNVNNANILTRAVGGYLAMVTAKVSGTVAGIPCMMLIDTGSELNLMTMELYNLAQIPMDPSGGRWGLKGVNGNPVPLAGICRKVETELGGTRFDGNFFVTRDGLGDKDIILGQPWLYRHAGQISYELGVGVTLQFWQDGDHEQGDSVGDAYNHPIEMCSIEM